MSRESDPQAITDALTAATDAFNEEGFGVPTREEAINSDADWKTQLTKACRLLAAVEGISDQGFYTAIIKSKENTRVFRREMNPTTHPTTHRRWHAWIFHHFQSAPLQEE